LNKGSIVRIYVIGADGQIARSLREQAARDPNLAICCGARPDVDILRLDLVERALVAFRPDIVINPAAYTAVDRAETEPDLAFAVNRDGAKNVAAVTSRLNIPVIHFSTDYVFDGTKHGRYVETDDTRPLGIYGQSKLEGEWAVAEANHRHIILRTSWVYAPFGNNFVRTVLRLASDRSKLGMVDDQVGCPTYAPDVAEATLAIARKIAISGWKDQFGGVTHLAGPEQVSWCAFARQIMLTAKTMGARSVPVDAITTKDYPTPAARPANSRLNCDRLLSVFDSRLPPLGVSLEKCLQRLVGAGLSPRSIS
jgi:dTDP-4-dehydrorhamnose reductase